MLPQPMTDASNLKQPLELEAQPSYMNMNITGAPCMPLDFIRALLIAAESSEDPDSPCESSASSARHTTPNLEEPPDDSPMFNWYVVSHEIV